MRRSTNTLLNSSHSRARQNKFFKSNSNSKSRRRKDGEDGEEEAIVASPSTSPSLSFLYPPSCFFNTNNKRYHSTSTSTSPSTNLNTTTIQSSPQGSGVTLNDTYSHHQPNFTSSPNQSQASSSSSSASSSYLNTPSNLNHDPLNNNNLLRSGSYVGVLGEERERVEEGERILQLVSLYGHQDSTFQKVKDHLQDKVSVFTGNNQIKFDLNNNRSQNPQIQRLLREKESERNTRIEIQSYIESLESNSLHSFSSNKDSREQSITIQTQGFQNLFFPFIKAYYSQSLFYQAGKLLVFLLIGLEQFERNYVKEIVEVNGGTREGKVESSSTSNNQDGDEDGEDGKRKRKKKKPKTKESHLNFNSADLIMKETEILIPEILRDLIRESNLRIQNQIKNQSSSSFNFSTIPPSTVHSIPDHFDPQLSISILNSSFSLNWNWSKSKNSIETSKILIDVIRDCFKNLELFNGLKLLNVVLKGLWEIEERVQIIHGDEDRNGNGNDRWNLNHTLEERKENLPNLEVRNAFDVEISNQEKDSQMNQIELESLETNLKFLKKSCKDLFENFKFNLRFNLRTYENFLKKETGTKAMINHTSSDFSSIFKSEQLQETSMIMIDNDLKDGHSSTFSSKEFPHQPTFDSELSTAPSSTTKIMNQQKDWNGNLKMMTLSNQQKGFDEIRMDYSKSVLLLSEMICQNYYPLALNSSWIEKLNSEGDSKFDQNRKGSVAESDESLASASNFHTDFFSSSSPSSQNLNSTPTSISKKLQKFNSPSSKLDLSSQKQGEDINWILKRCFNFNQLVLSNNSSGKRLGHPKSSKVQVELMRISKEIDRNLVKLSDQLPIGFLGLDFQAGIEWLKERENLNLNDNPSSSSPSSTTTSSTLIPTSSPSLSLSNEKIFRRIKSNHISKFSYNSLSNHFLNQNDRKNSSKNLEERKHRIGLKVLNHMIDLKKLKEAQSEEMKDGNVLIKTKEDDLEIDQVTLNIVNRSNRLSRRRNKSSLNPSLVSNSDIASDSTSNLLVENQFRPSLGERRKIKYLTSQSSMIAKIDEEVEKGDSYAINEMLTDFLVTSSAGREKWFPINFSNSTPSTSKGDVISIKHLIYHLYPKLNPRRKRGELKVEERKKTKRKEREEILSNPKILTTSLNLAVKSGKAGLAFSLWSLIKKESSKSLKIVEEKNSSNPSENKGKDKKRGWHIPLEAATLFFQLCQNESKKGIFLKTFLPKYQTYSTNFKYFNKFLEDKNKLKPHSISKDHQKPNEKGVDISSIENEDLENVSFFDGSFRNRKNDEIRNVLRNKIGRFKLKLNDSRRGGMVSVSGRNRKRWSMRNGQGLIEKRGKIYLVGRSNLRSRRRRSNLTGRNKIVERVETNSQSEKEDIKGKENLAIESIRNERGSGWRSSKGPKIRRRDAARELARENYFDLMSKWGYYSVSKEVLNSSSTKNPSSSPKSSSSHLKFGFKSLNSNISSISRETSSRVPNCRTIHNLQSFPEYQSKGMNSSHLASSAPELDARFFNSLLETFGKFDGMLLRESKTPTRESVIKKLRIEISIWESNELSSISTKLEEQELNFSNNSSFLSPTTQIFLTQNNAHQLLPKFKPLNQTLTIVLRDFYQLGFRIPLGYLQFLPFSLGLDGDEARKVLEELLKEEERFVENVRKNRSNWVGKGRGKVRFDLYRLEEGKRREKGLN